MTTPFEYHLEVILIHRHEADDGEEQVRRSGPFSEPHTNGAESHARAVSSDHDGAMVRIVPYRDKHMRPWAIRA